ncbi:unnamed protein product [Arabis nemorensis]|uniref:Transmembrane protein n=1 Tax=Arabis nemorensis TaxID=586526 RepID=A0A565BB12_9BRAS|nr:unnamed protein product [Arabis nemorensis]
MVYEVGCNHAQSVGFSTDGFATKNHNRNPRKTIPMETLGLFRRWNIPARPPANMIHPGLIGLCSKPFQKQLTKKEVNFEEDQEQSKLVLSKSLEIMSLRRFVILVFGCFGTKIVVRFVWLLIL